jgi:hypothetical protein
MGRTRLKSLRRSSGGKAAGVEASTGFVAKKSSNSVGIRWTPRRKAALVIAVDAGLLSIKEALSRYNLSVEEFSSWQQSFRYFGMHLPKARARAGMAAGRRHGSSRE